MRGDLVPQYDELYLSDEPKITSIECQSPFLSEDTFKCIGESMVLQRITCLVDLSDLDDLERLHDKDLYTSSNVAWKEALRIFWQFQLANKHLCNINIFIYFIYQL